MNYYKLVVSYDGTDYFGWQSQSHGKTIQNVMADTFLDVFKLPCQLLAASRTDTGVHALGQVVSLRTELDIDSVRMLQVFNAGLTQAIKIESLEKIDHKYNPHADVAQKTYQYRIFTAKASPMLSRFGWLPPMPERVDWQKFALATQVFVGKHNFSAFSRIEEGEEREPMRQVTSVDCVWQSPTELLVTIIGHSFLRYQIRRMIGAAFEVARKRQFLSSTLEQSLKTGQALPPQIAFRAPAMGLCLQKIEYLKKIIDD